AAAGASVVLVTIPEAMAFEESARYLKSLREEGVPVTDLVVNRVEREHAACPFCRARARMQARWLRALGREFKTLRQRRVPLFPAEVRGHKALRDFARAVWQSDCGLRIADCGLKTRACSSIRNPHSASSKRARSGFPCEAKR